MLRQILLVLLLLIISLTAWAAPDARTLTTTRTGNAKRLALVIGNDHYQHVSTLRNAVSDAQAMAAALERAGFQVILKTDISLDTFKQAIRQFKASLSGGDQALFFYAGHAVEIQNVNYLLPISIRKENDEQVKDDSFPLQRLLDDLREQKVGFALTIIDACRTNPFGGGTDGRSIGGKLGLAAQPASGQMILFSAGTGKEALDRLSPQDNHPNGVFTRVFLQEMQTPGTSVQQLLFNVRSRVLALTDKRQNPALYDESAGSDFYFYPAAPPPVPSVAAVVSAAPTKTAEQIEDEFWEAIKNSSDARNFERYRQTYPSGRYLGLAALKIEQLRPVAPVVRPIRLAYEPDMVPIPSGSYTMGCSRSLLLVGSRDSDCSDDEKPEHTVNLERFELGKYEVTQGQWKAVMGSNPSSFKDCGDTCPVENVSWDEIQTFIQKLNAQTGKTYRLPSEAEWEYACRAGQSSNYCGGDNVDSVAWYTSNSGNKTHPVGGKQSNVWGLYDMSGNVWEWVQDSYHSDYKGAPSNGNAWEGSRADARVLRGGSWNNNPQDVRAALRIRNVATVRGLNVGFRLARTLP